jgi:phosphatidylglycerol---prolipoprotein diacylglyceryl transferase
MRAHPFTGTANPGFPRFFRIAGFSINSYKFFLCVGIYLGTLATAALASYSGLSPLRVGLATMACALVGMIGARLYYLLVHAPFYLRQRSLSGLWNSGEGGWSVFGTLITFIPASLVAAAWLAIPATVLWDHMAIGVLVGGFWVRLGCVFNGCCAGAETKSKLSVRLHDTCGVRKPRIPVQFLEMAWWLMGFVTFVMLWPGTIPPGSYALAVIAFYGVGRVFLEPLREESDVVFGRVRIDQFVAALLALGAGSVLLMRAWAG